MLFLIQIGLFILLLPYILLALKLCFVILLAIPKAFVGVLRDYWNELKQPECWGLNKEE